MPSKRVQTECIAPGGCNWKPTPGVYLRLGLCQKHYEQARVAGTLGKGPLPKCKHDDCDKPANGQRGRCLTHYRQLLEEIAGRPLKHGLTGYVQRKCKCDVCTEAHRLYRVKQRAKLRRQTELVGWNGKHGNRYAYNEARCRCAICVRWHEGTLKEKEVPEVLRNVYTEVGDGSQTVVHWMPAEGDIHSCQECSARFVKKDGQWLTVGSNSAAEMATEPARRREGA